VHENALSEIRVPATILTAVDDPIIPVEDFYRLHVHEPTCLAVQPFGGHNGFVDGWALQSWYDDRMAALFQRHCNHRRQIE
jgi:predicted alpha/beta-fold hydrolase